MDLLRLLETIRTPLFDNFFAMITYLGDDMFFMAITAAFLWCVNKKWGYRLAFIGLIGSSINQILKAIFVVPRPWVIDENFTIVEAARADATGYSFPSGHTQSVTSIGLAASSFIKKKWVYAVSIVLILLTAFSRMYLGVHTPLDVGVSLITGILSVVLLNIVFKRIDSNESKQIKFVICAIALLVFQLLFVLFAPKGEANIAEFDLHAIKNASTMLGTMLGLSLSWWLDKKQLNYEIKAVWWAQVLKLIVGLLLVLGVKTGTKVLFTALFGQSYLLDGIRYFIMTVFAMLVWPLTFKWWSKLGQCK